jgi:hypothetical protein
MLNYSASHTSSTAGTFACGLLSMVVLLLKPLMSDQKSLFLNSEQLLETSSISLVYLDNHTLLNNNN